jgi:UDP-N-acetylmuramate: L-alanyl-gamma-D-glutamyl-meso-diaminopimelate ligase
LLSSLLIATIRVNTTMKKAHFIGICGVGMGGTALLLKEQGWNISGSDDGIYPPMSTYLEENGINYATSYNPSNIPTDVDIIVVGRHAKLAKNENEEVRAAYAHGAPVSSFAEVVGDMLVNKQVVTVAGSHGKSTCTALVAWCLKNSGRDSGYFVGAVPKQKNMSVAHVGTEPFFIIEGDEYPSSHKDNRAKFLHYNTHDLLLTSVAHDHANIYPTHKEYISPFLELISSVPKDGIIVANSNDTSLHKFGSQMHPEIKTYGIAPTAEWYASDIKTGKETTFILMHENKSVVHLTTSLMGMHNIENIVGASAMLLEKKLITPDELASGVKTFNGLARRLELVTNHSSVDIYEGFGTSYSKARSAISAVKTHFPDKRLFVLFEPHTFSWRNKEMLYWYDDVFLGADRVVIYSPPEHGKESHSQASLEEIMERVKNAEYKNMQITSAQKPEKILTALGDELSSNDVVLILSSGELGGLTQTLPKHIEKKFPA